MPDKQPWQEEYAKQHRFRLKRPDLAQDFYAKREKAWLFVSQQLARILGYALSRHALDAESRATLHANCLSEVLIAIAETDCSSTTEFEQEALRQCANRVARALYAQKKSWRVEQYAVPYEVLEEQMTKPIWDLGLYHQFLDVAYQLQEKASLLDRRACRLLIQTDIETMAAQDLKLFVLYLLVVLLQQAKASKLERRALIGAFLLGDDDQVTSEKIYKRTSYPVEASNVRKARSKGLGKLKKFLQSVDDVQLPR